MRKRFVQQLSIGQIPIELTPISLKQKNSLHELLAALKEIFCNSEYSEKIFSIMDRHINGSKNNTGRPGLDLWEIFVLSQVRLCLNASYGVIHDLANNHHVMRCVMGIAHEFSYPRIELEYQNIYDNVSKINDPIIREINEVIVEFGHKEVFKKKETAALRLKSDSFVVESNVHFPTDYNLLFDCVRKCVSTVEKFLTKHDQIAGWRKIKDWQSQLKGLMRELGRTSSSGGKGKELRLKTAARKYLTKANTFCSKLESDLPLFPINDNTDLGLIITMEHFIVLLKKHIDLVNRRLLKGEKIPHDEKLFSIFETYTEWVNKGKSRPNVELGKKLCITTDQYNLIVDYQLMNHEQDRDIVIEIADRILRKYNILSWSLDKGFWRKENKELLQLEVPQVIMPKLGKRNKTELEEERTKAFKKLKNKHSTVESNINELENRGLDRCPDKGIIHFTRYIGLGVCAYNLKKIGRKIIELKRIELKRAS